jgi:tetratricopeptide (TPR) repeat protein
MNPFGNRDRSLLCGVLLCSIFSALGAPPKGSTDTADDLFKRGEALASSGRVAEAEVQLSSAATLAPHDPGILTLLAKVKARLGESKEAVELFRRVAGERPRSATAHLNLAIALADAGDPTSALAEVDKSILLDPQSLTAHLNRARMLADANRVSAARAEFLRTERIHPGDPETEFFHAVLEKDNHRPQAASALLARVVARQPDNGQAYFLLGQTLQALNREEEAVAAFPWRLPLPNGLSQMA